MFDHLTPKSKQDECALVGLECESCASSRGRDLASVCSSLSATSIESAFTRMYPDVSCAEMLGVFAQAYFESTGPILTILNRAIAAA